MLVHSPYLLASFLDTNSVLNACMSADFYTLDNVGVLRLDWGQPERGLSQPWHPSYGTSFPGIFNGCFLYILVLLVIGCMTLCIMFFLKCISSLGGPGRAERQDISLCINMKPPGSESGQGSGQLRPLGSGRRLRQWPSPGWLPPMDRGNECS